MAGPSAGANGVEETFGGTPGRGIVSRRRSGGGRRGWRGRSGRDDICGEQGAGEEQEPGCQARTVNGHKVPHWGTEHVMVRGECYGGVCRGTSDFAACDFWRGGMP